MVEGGMWRRGGRAPAARVCGVKPALAAALAPAWSAATQRGRRVARPGAPVSEGFCFVFGAPPGPGA
jgi:hypothetical protein